MNNSYNILITGGAGAIGSNLAHVLIEQGHQVWVIDNLSSGFFTNLPKNVRFIKGDILDNTLLNEVFGNKIDYVFHLAALFANQNSVLHPEKDLNENALGTLKLLEHARKYQVKKLIFSSSSCVYGNLNIMSEESPLPFLLDTPYAITKLSGEYYCKFFSKHHGFDTVILRLFNSYGPGEMPGVFRNVIPNFISKALRGESLVITGTGKETRDFTYVKDIVQGMILAAFTKTIPGESFNLASGRATTVQELVDKINKITNNKAPIIYQERRDWDNVLHRVGIIEKAKNLLNFEAKTPLEEGLVKTYEWLKKDHV